MKLLMTVVTLALGVSLVALTSEAQQAGKSARVGFLAIGSPQLPYYLAFREGMRDLNYNEAQNLVLEAQFSEDARGLDELAIDLVRRKVDVIVVVGGAPAERRGARLKAFRSSLVRAPISLKQASSRVRLGRAATSRG